MSPVRRILYICHDGQLYGSQHSLQLILRFLPEPYQPFVSIARSGPLNQALTTIPRLTVLQHRRVQWVKHDRRSWLQKMGDVAGLVLAAPLRVLQLHQAIRKHQIDCVHTNSLVSLEGALAAKLAGIPHIWHIRELFMEENPKLQMMLGRKLTRWLVVNLSKQVICISEAVKRQFQPYHTLNRCRVIYNVVDSASARISRKPLEGTFTVGYIGRLSAGKRVQDLIAAMALLKKQALPIRLWVIGAFVDEPFETLINQTIQALQLEKEVVFLGYQPNLAAYYPQLDVLVLPSLNEPFGRVLIEAMQAQVPCIAADSGGVPEIIKDGMTGLLYPPGDVDALARRISEAMAHPERMAVIVENAGRMVQERFTIEKQMSALTACYQTL